MTTTAKAAYTPGPWEVDWERKWVRSIVEDSIVATVEKDMHYRGEADANSSLIAAAPEMLEALELLTKALQQISEMDDGCLYVNGRSAQQLISPFAKAEAAIQKARGGQ